MILFMSYLIKNVCGNITFLGIGFLAIWKLKLRK